GGGSAGGVEAPHRGLTRSGEAQLLGGVLWRLGGTAQADAPDPAGGGVEHLEGPAIPRMNDRAALRDSTGEQHDQSRERRDTLVIRELDVQRAVDLPQWRITCCEVGA